MVVSDRENLLISTQECQTSEQVWHLMAAHTTLIPKKSGHCKKKKKRNQNLWTKHKNTTVVTDNRFTKCSLSPCSYRCLIHFEEAPFIPNLDTITCYQWNCLNVVFLEDYTTFPSCVAPVTICLKWVAGIKLGFGFFWMDFQLDAYKLICGWCFHILFYAMKYISKYPKHELYIAYISWKGSW